MTSRSTVQSPSAWGTRAKLGQRFYPRNAAEIAATITPVNYFEDYGFPERYGAAADGATNDLTALRAVIAVIAQGGRVLRLKRGKTYAIAMPGDASKPLHFNGLSNFVVDGERATIKVLNGEAVGSMTGVMYFTDCTDSEISKIRIDANRANRTPAEVYSHSVTIEGGARLKFSRVRSVNAVTDGFYVVPSDVETLSTYPTDVTFVDCSADNAYRNNLSVIGSVRFTDVRGRYTGATGTSPEAGVDVESNSTTDFSNTWARFIDTDCSGNAGHGMSVSGDVTNENITIKGLTGSGNGDQLLNIGNVDVCNVISPVVGNHTTPTRGIIDVASLATRVRVSGARYADITASESGARALLYIHSAATKVTVTDFVANNVSLTAIAAHSDDVTIHGVTVLDSTAAFGVSIGPAAARAIVRNIVVKRVTGYGVYFESPNGRLDNAYVEDSDSTTGAIRFAVGATDFCASSLHVHETSGTPPGVAVRIDVAPKSLHGIMGTGGYTASTLFNSLSNLASTRFSGLSPNPFTTTITINPSSLATGVVSNSTTNFSGAQFGDHISVHAPYDLQGIIAQASVSTADNIRFLLYNPTAGAIDLASGDWIFQINRP